MSPSPVHPPIGTSSQHHEAPRDQRMAQKLAWETALLEAQPAAARREVPREGPTSSEPAKADVLQGDSKQAPMEAGPRALAAETAGTTATEPDATAAVGERVVATPLPGRATGTSPVPLRLAEGLDARAARGARQAERPAPQTPPPPTERRQGVIERDGVLHVWAVGRELDPRRPQRWIASLQGLIHRLGGRLGSITLNGHRVFEAPPAEQRIPNPDDVERQLDALY